MISLSTLFVNELRFDNRFFSIKRTYYYMALDRATWLSTVSQSFRPGHSALDRATWL